MWAFEECDNEDSCEPGATHAYPDPLTRVFIASDVEGRVVGGNDVIAVPWGMQTVGKHVDHMAHMVSIEVNRHNLSALVWVDLDDILPPSKLDLQVAELGAR